MYGWTKNGSAGDQLCGNDDVAARLKFPFSNGVSITIQVTFDQNVIQNVTRRVHQFCPVDLLMPKGELVAKLWLKIEPDDENYDYQPSSS